MLDSYERRTRPQTSISYVRSNGMRTLVVVRALLDPPLALVTVLPSGRTTMPRPALPEVLIGVRARSRDGSSVTTGKKSLRVTRAAARAWATRAAAACTLVLAARASLINWSSVGSLKSFHHSRPSFPAAVCVAGLLNVAGIAWSGRL